MLLDSVRRALGREPTAHRRGHPEAVRTASGKVPTPVRQGSDSLPTGVRQESDSPPAARRKRSGLAPKGTPERVRTPRKGRSTPRLMKVERGPALVGNAVDHHGAPAHAKHLMESLRVSGFRAGDMIMSRTLQQLYDRMCDELGWLPLPWGGANGIGKQMRMLTGGKKTYRDVFAGGRTYTNERVYILPPWPARTQGSAGNVTPLAAHAAPERSAAA